MTIRVQVILDEEERESFRRQAQDEGLSLSGWLREAGRRQLAANHSKIRLRTADDLRTFFHACDVRERGREPDWEEHRAVIEGSIRNGGSDT